MDESNLLLGLLFGAVGMGYMLYGRRQKSLMPFIAGIGLIGFPYFVDNNGVVLLLGTILMALPFVIKL